MLYQVNIGPLVYPGRPSGPHYVDVLVRLKDKALQADLENEHESRVLEFLDLNRIDKPHTEAEMEALLAFICAQNAATTWTLGTLETSVGHSPTGNISVQPAQQEIPDRPAEHTDNKCEAWCSET